MHNSRRCGHREGEGVHLLYFIVVTAPVFHFDKSELNQRKELNTAREKGTTTKRKDQPTTNHNKRVPFQTHKNKKEQNV